MSAEWLTGEAETDFNKLIEVVNRKSLTDSEKNFFIADFCQRYYLHGLTIVAVKFCVGLHWSIPAIVISAGIGFYSFINYDQFDLIAWISLTVVEALLLGPTIFRVYCYGYSIVALSFAATFRSVCIFYGKEFDTTDLADEAVYSQSNILYILSLFVGAVILFFMPMSIFINLGK